MKRFLKLSVLPIALLVLSPALQAQDWVGRGRVAGQVTDQEGNPIQGATVTLTQVGAEEGEDAGPDPLTTNKKGKWSYLGLEGGMWHVLIEYEGMVPSEGNVEVNEFGASESVRVQLRPIPEEELVDEEAIEAKKELEEGNTLMQSGQYAEARALYESALSKLDAEYHAMIQAAIAQTYLSEGKPEDAEAMLEKVLVAQPGDPGTLRLLARAQYEAGRVDDSIATLDELLTAHPDDVTTTKVMVDLLVRAGREEEAQQYMAKLPEGEKVSPETRLNTGIDFYNEGKLDAALEQFDRTVQENPDLPDAYYYRALVYLAQQKNPEAKADLERLLELAPDHPKAAEAKEFLEYLK